MLFTNSCLYDLIGILTALLAIIVVYYKWTFTYWKQNGFEGPEPSIPFGNIGDLILGRKHFGEIFRDVYFHAKDRGRRYGIMFLCLKPCIVPTDLDLIKSIIQMDFVHFWGHGSFVNEEDDPLSANLFNLEGPKWKSIRTRLTPTFTSGKMKMMFQTLVDCSKRLENILRNHFDNNEAVEVKDIMARFTTDVIGSCAFGLDCNCLENPDSDFRHHGLKTIETNFKQTVKNMTQVIFPDRVLRFCRFRPTDSEVANFFSSIVKDTVSYREKNRITRNDFMDLLIKLKNKETTSKDDTVNDEGLTLDEITAQSLLFFIAGFETSSTTMHCAAYELAVNQDIQERLRKEINSVLEKYNNVLTYDAVMEMKYLDKAVSETLRKYPALPVLFRQCSKDYTIPGTDKVITKGTSLIVPVLGIHYDPEYYPDPEKFDPERFSEENKADRPAMTWLPFGEGPRICIGMRFGLMQTKVGLITLLRNYKITLNEKTTTPLVLRKHGIMISFEGQLWFNLQKI